MQITGEPLSGQVSQSAQWAVGAVVVFHDCLLTVLQPFNAHYEWFNTTDNLIIPNASLTYLNPYKGAAFQQAASGVTQTSTFLSSSLHRGPL